jgi:hypothetical protein
MLLSLGTLALRPEQCHQGGLANSGNWEQNIRLGNICIDFLDIVSYYWGNSAGKW